MKYSSLGLLVVESLNVLYFKEEWRLKTFFKMYFVILLRTGLDFYFIVKLIA